MISEFVKSLILAIIQGATEWLPISSSGHLVLFEKILGFKGGGIEFDVALHFGTLMAVFVYFGKDIVDIIENLLKGKWKSEKGKLGLMVLVATIPSAVIGLLFRKIFESIPPKPTAIKRLPSEGVKNVVNSDVAALFWNTRKPTRRISEI